MAHRDRSGTPGLHHRVYQPAVMLPGLLPWWERTQVEPRAVLTVPDPHPAAVGEASTSLSGRVAAGDGLLAAEHTALLFRDQLQLRIHLSSMTAIGTQPRPRPQICG